MSFPDTLSAISEVSVECEEKRSPEPVDIVISGKNSSHSVIGMSSKK